MKRSAKFLGFCMIAVLVYPLMAQVPLERTPPPGPLIDKEMPDYAQWTIDYTYTDARKAGEDSPQLAQYKKLALTDPDVARALSNPRFIAALNPARPLHVVITKTKTTLHEDCSLEQGQKSEVWGSEGIHITRLPNSAQLSVTVGNAATHDEFPEFYWINKETFAGIEVQGGIKCLVFKGEADSGQLSTARSSVSGVKMPVTAYISLETRHPVSLQFGVETRQYTYQPAPTEDLVIPDEFASAARATIEHIRQATGQH